MLYAIPKADLSELMQKLPDNINFQILSTSPIRAMVSSRSPLAKLNCITERELLKYSLAIYNNGDIFLDLLGIPYEADRIILKTQNIDFCRTFVAQNIYSIHFTDQTAETFLSKKNSLVSLPVKPTVHLVYGIISNQKMQCSQNRISELIHTIDNEFQDLSKKSPCSRL